MGPGGEMVVVGIDPSLSHTGICCLVGDETWDTGVVATDTNAVRPERLVAVRTAVQELLASLQDPRRLVVAMESQVWSHRAEFFAADAAVYGVLQVAVWEAFAARRTRGVEGGIGGTFLSVNPQHVKKWLGAREKAEVLLRVYKLYGVEFRDHNQADAFTLARIGAAFDAFRRDPAAVPVTKAQREVLQKLAATGCPWNPGAPSGRRRSSRSALGQRGVA